MTETALFLSVVVPCFNEEAVLPELYRRLSAVCAGLAQPYEIILVDDGSEDASWDLISGYAASDKAVKGIHFSRNFGHSMAVTAGLKASNGAHVLILDADLQDPPELLSEMLALMDSAQADVVYGQRLAREAEGWGKRLTASLFYRLLNRISEFPIPRDTGDFRLMKRSVVREVCAMPEYARYIRGMVAWVGFRQVPLPYERKRRFAGNPHYTLGKMVNLAMDAITGFSVHPVRLAFYMGLFMLAASFGLFVYVMVSYLEEETVRGWASLAFILVFSQAFQWMMLGLMGEYIGRIYLESKRRPHYIVKETVGAFDAPKPL
ncbi:MAG: glycosyltransferase family 2 protein [Rickettsiales bacterium]|nr:glycosyltransferase family 2 protein [Rickettsiales bacterium]